VTSGRPIAQTDIAAITDLVGACRAHAAGEAFPAVADVAPLFADESSRASARCWDATPTAAASTGRLDAWVLAQPEFGNVLFDVRPSVREALSVEVVETGVRALAETGATSADTPLESDDRWRRGVLEGTGFEPTGDDVIHLRNDDPTAYADRLVAEDVTVVSNADDLDAYVAAHRAAFGTTYLTRARREVWSDDVGYDRGLDLALVVDGEVAAFAVSYLRGIAAEVGTVGVAPSRRGRGLGESAVRRALAELAERGARTATMSTSSTNEHMLRVADRCGFHEYRRTSWWHRDL
jgi:ribosomal protein S18 acetylase RimI-like enzyme